MRRLVHGLATISIAAVAVVATPVVAAALPVTGRDFGQHVAECAQTMGFDGLHNPGMHQGFAGWAPMLGC